ncbi:SpoIIIAH-like family protein [Effusibacillus lacus]|uniref:Stage III sporulation protein AH n=1 Tax=Effusibacillus lacus TaxID=1348429 RepID=A0A292YLU0_9BACL|nr:SpoIIIAH-like family protein [Effusibacillus lacus]TCS72529.1 stage III sporulation protein AH [Effusibacillus lacus]GAX90908.1 hypothetical protein EFBL_2550 [Effusibacillus lacus]
MANRQTVWLSTMMILSLMVIGYYTVDDTLKPVPTSSTENAKNQDQTKTPDPKDNSNDSTKNQNNGTEKKQTMTGADWFGEQIANREVTYYKQAEELQKVIADAKTSTEQKVKAEQELKAMQDFYQKAEQAENKVIAEGFAEALVTKDKERVTVTVQAPELSKEQAAKIYSIVSKELGIPAHQITVSYKQ